MENRKVVIVKITLYLFIFIQAVSISLYAATHTSFDLSNGNDLRTTLPSFPGAEGFGSNSVGGRGDGISTPRVIIVDTLEDKVANI